jgi:putative oxidoreductase
VTSNRLAGPVWSIFRIVIGLLFACHGLAGLFGVFGGSRGAGQGIPVGTWPGWYAAVIQLVCGGLVIAGLFTRPAAILASGSMAYAYFTVHQPNGLMPIENGGVTPALYAWTFLVIAVLGSGPWSVDALLGKRKSGAAQAQTPVAAETASAPA